MPPVSDLVHLSELDVHFSPELDLTTRRSITSRPGQRRSREEEHWRRGRRLGKGGFGAVYLARCVKGVKHGEIQAVKEIQKSTGSNYNRELEAIALFSHSKYEDYFVKSFGWYSIDDKIFITLEYLEHGDLQQYLGSPLPEREGQHLVHQVLEGLDFMHEHGFAHRDLKPANILVVRKAPEWWVKIADFGISKRATEGLTALRTQTGTPAFVAPEVLGLGHVDDTDDGTYTHTVDIWSTGVIAFLILTGETYFRDTRRLGQYAGGRLAFPLDALLARSISESGCKFTESCMAPKPQDRPGTKELLQHSWFIDLDRPEGSWDERNLDIENLSQSTQSSNNPKLPTSSNSREEYLALGARSGNDTGPSAVWSTNEQDSKPSARLHSESELHIGHSAQEGHSDYTTSAYHGIIPYGQDAAVPTTSLIPNSIAQTQIHWSEVKVLKGHGGYIYAVAVSPDGQLVASGSGDKTVRLWDVGTGTEIKRLEGHQGRVEAVAFSPDGQLVASSSRDETVRLWDVGTGAEIKVLKGHGHYVNAVAYSPDGRLVASGSYEKTVRLWDVGTGAEVKRLKGHGHTVSAVTFSPDGQLVVSGSADKTVRLWDVGTGAEIKRLEGHQGRVEAVAFSPDGQLVVSGSADKTVSLWDIGTGAEIKRLEGHGDNVYAVAVSPDGQLVASGSYDETVRLWDVGTGAEVKRLEGHEDWVYAVAFSPDGRLVASGSLDKTVRLWDWRAVAPRENTSSENSSRENTPRENTPREPRGRLKNIFS